MFSYLKHSTIVWLLMQLMDFSYQTTHGHLFPSFPKEISGESFTMDFKYNGLSDLIYAKCPGSQYYHTNEEDVFKRNEELSGVLPYLFTDNKAFIWIPMVYNMSGSGSIYCGILVHSKKNSTSSGKYKWHFNLGWKKKPDPIKMAQPFTVSTKLPDVRNKCGGNQSRIQIYSNDKKNGLKRLQFKEKISSRVNALYYYFKTPDNNEKLEMVEPCVIVRAIYKEPEIIIKGHNSTLISSKDLDLHVIKQDHVAGIYSIKLYLENEYEVPDFYEGEKVKITKMKFKKSGIEEIPSSDEEIGLTFTLKGFQVVKFSYDCPSHSDTTKVEKIFYFGPGSEEYVFPNRHTIYLQNDTAVQPNCSIHRINFGYLDMVIVDDGTVHLSELEDGGAIKNNLKRVKDFVFMSNVDKNNVTLQCFYITPNGNVTLVETFIKGVKVFVKYGENGEAIHEVKVESAESSHFKDMLAEKDKELAAERKTFFQKLKDNIGIFGAYTLVIGFYLLIFIIILVISILCFVKVVKPWIVRKKIQSKHPNIFAFWNELSSNNLEKYSELVQSKNYVPEKLKGKKHLKVIEGGEEVDKDTSFYFDDTLVKCYKDIYCEIKAHYISDVSPNRTYIISDGPAAENVKYFWELLYREDVGVVVSIIYLEHEMTKNSNNKMLYWPEKQCRYGKVNVELEKDVKSEIPFVAIKKFIVTMQGGDPKKVTVFHVSNWREHEIPHTDLFFIKLYEEVSTHAGSRKVLTHSSHGSGSRVFMYTYFCCIFEAMEANETIDNPLEVVKEVRARRYGGSISSMEYAYIVKTLVTFFFERKMLVDITKHQLDFSKEYENFIFKLNLRDSNINSDIKNFLTFVNIIDDGKLRDLVQQAGKTQMLKPSDVQTKCTRFATAIDQSGPRKARYNDIPCLDNAAVLIRGIGPKDMRSFIHANEFRYKYGDKERKIIMCQAPTEETMDDMLDMIHRYKVGIIVILVNKQEMDEGEKCFNYLHKDRGEKPFGTYNLLFRGCQPMSNNYFCEYNYSVIDKTSRLVHSFKVLHYTIWPDKGIPTESQSLHGFYKRIIELYDNSHIAIHCSAGIGRTGILALIIHMIDVIKSKAPFDPIKCLATVRTYRCKAVQTAPQFVFALAVVYEHFKDEIEEMDKKAYGKFMAVAEKYLVKKMIK
uniref:Protein-tyrosine-phosphatase n=1 Tax=Strongyloides stercoralis TaxID=6248 RepID=A0A0K0DSQ4_STRER